MNTAADCPTLGTRARNWRWLAYAAPCLLVWSYYHWVFWPAILCPDGIDQWHQAATGTLSDWHPAFHTMTMWLAMRFCRSPALYISVQIVALAGLVGWSLAVMRRAGMPWWMASLIAIAVAILPANGCSVVTLMKDTPYTIAFLLLNVLVLRVVLSSGESVRGRWRWILPGLAGALLALLRHNGWPVAFVTLFLLVPAFRQDWRPLMLSLVLAVGGWLFVRGPVYRALAVAPPPSYMKAGTCLHHISAHLAYGTEFAAEERVFLGRLHPLEDGKWPYDPYNLGVLLFSPKLKLEALQLEDAEIWRLFLRLTRRNPRVALRHALDAASLVWQIRQPRGATYARGFLEWDRRTVYVLDPKEYKREPGEWTWRIVEVRRPYPPLLVRAARDSWSWLLWRPALPMYLLLVGALIAWRRGRSWHYLLIACPTAVQSSVMLLVCPACEFRYQWPVFLGGLLFAPFLWWCVPFARKAGSPHAANQEVESAGAVVS